MSNAYWPYLLGWRPEVADHRSTLSRRLIDMLCCLGLPLCKAWQAARDYYLVINTLATRRLLSLPKPGRH